MVQIFRYKKKFEKELKGSWSFELYSIKLVGKTRRGKVYYRIQDYSGEEILGKFYNNELKNIMVKQR